MWLRAESALWVVCPSAYFSFVTVRHSRPGRRGSWTGRNQVADRRRPVFGPRAGTPGPGRRRDG